MAFKTAAGYGNLPNGNFSPIIYSKQVQLAFRKTSVVENITNSDYFGEIANMGDSVKSLKSQRSLLRNMLEVLTYSLKTLMMKTSH